MIVVPFIPAHLESIEVIEEMSFITPYLKDENYANMLTEGEAYTGLVDGKVIACSGAIKINEYRYVAWALMGKDSGKHMLQITREIKDFYKRFKGKRLEIEVEEGFKKAHRWAKMLGFKNETPNGRPYFGNEGENYYLYARY